jgi:hypothetical protein
MTQRSMTQRSMTQRSMTQRSEGSIRRSPRPRAAAERIEAVA